MKNLTIAALLVFAMACSGRRGPSGPSTPPDLTPPDLVLTRYSCALRGGCPSQEQVQWNLESAHRCVFGVFVERMQGKMRPACSPRQLVRTVEIRAGVNPQQDKAGQDIVVWVDPSGKTEEEMRQLALSLAVHAELHNAMCTSAGNAAHCIPGETTGHSGIWCKCCQEMGRGC